MKRLNLKATFAAIAAGAAVALASCATPTPYQPVSDRGSGGYAEYQITSDRFRVSFQGNSITQRDTVERYLLYRAAELTLQEGYDRFELVDRDTERQVQRYSTPVTSTYWAWTPSWYYLGNNRWTVIDTLQPYWYDRWETREATSYQATAEIRLASGAGGADNPRSFNAREVIDNLGPTIERPESRG
jgi:hypothetical protein